MQLFEDVISDLKYVSNFICPKSTTQLGPIVSYYMGLLFYETHVCSHWSALGAIYTLEQ